MILTFRRFLTNLWLERPDSSLSLDPSLVSWRVLGLLPHLVFRLSLPRFPFGDHFGQTESRMVIKLTLIVAGILDLSPQVRYSVLTTQIEGSLGAKRGCCAVL